MKAWTRTVLISGLALVMVFAGVVPFSNQAPRQAHAAPQVDLVFDINPGPVGSFPFPLTVGANGDLF
ncbi:MAG: hypothetical protein IIC82_08000, partial [Chloroflexi bacterium]|nr:hypothetical protein [Chloroflexota bacterium]